VTLTLLGTFTERVMVAANFTGGVALVGVGASPLDALIKFNMSGTAVGTFASWTVLIDASNVTLRNAAIANTAFNFNKTRAGQSVALDVEGDFFVAADATHLPFFLGFVFLGQTIFWKYNKF
jgi:pectin methylesterase-like acyl-CoA thioesterase